MVLPIDPNSASELDYLDPTNPASPFYDPSLDPNQSTVSSASQPNDSSAQIANPNAAVINPNSTSSNDLALEAKHHRRHMKNAEESQTIINNNSQILPTVQERKE